MEQTGLFIVIEGVDGAGKATQVQLLAERLEGLGYRVAKFDFPRYDEPSSYFVRQYLSGAYGELGEVGPYTASLFYALDRYEAAAAIRKALADGKIVVSDRFTGSNMAHHGTKFAHAEERRGYFVWLDNLEFQMLHIPRPDKSFVLRVPVDASQQLLDHSGKKRDLHEADSTHLQKAAEVFDDMIQLFPKDFSRLDCMRGGQLMSIGQVHELLWQAVEPFLPPPPKTDKPKKAELKAANPAPVLTATAPLEPEPKLLTPSQYISVPVGGVSDLLVSHLENEPSISYVEQASHQNADYGYVTPEDLDHLTRAKYQATMDKILETHAMIAAKLEGQPGASQALEALLPVAAKTSVTLSAQPDSLEHLIRRLQTHPSAEARHVGRQIQAKASEVMPQLTHLAAPAAAPRHHPSGYLQATHSTATQAIRLANASPRNELDLVPHMLYETSTLSLDEIEQQIAAWSMAQKAEVFEAYAREGSGRTLEQARYTWELHCEYQAYRRLQRTGIFDQLDTQALTPRYGYDIPKIIEDNGLDEAYEHCFDLSAKLYSLLQEAGHPAEAPYATLRGHRLRLKLTHTAADIPDFLETLKPNPTLHTQIHQKLTETHPLLMAAAGPTA